MLDMNIHKAINKFIFKRKTAKACINAKKKVVTCLPDTRAWKKCFGPQNSKIVYQNSRLSTTLIFNNRGKISILPKIVKNL